MSRTSTSHSLPPYPAPSILLMTTESVGVGLLMHHLVVRSGAVTLVCVAIAVLSAGALRTLHPWLTRWRSRRHATWALLGTLAGTAVLTAAMSAVGEVWRSAGVPILMAALVWVVGIAALTKGPPAGPQPALSPGPAVSERS